MSNIIIRYASSRTIEGIIRINDIFAKEKNGTLWLKSKGRIETKFWWIDRDIELVTDNYNSNAAINHSGY